VGRQVKFGLAFEFRPFGIDEGEVKAHGIRIVL
jgi:hypothetical protein